MLRMTHPSGNFFVLSLFCVLCMFVWLRVQGSESSVTKVLQKEELVNSKKIILQTSIKGVSSAGTNLVQKLKYLN
jgi:L-asparagine transporter-like permease